MAYINPDDDLNINLGRLLILIGVVQDIDKPVDVLTFDRLVIYEFLSKNPVLLIKVLNIIGKKHKIQIKDSESGSLSDSYINKSSMYNYKSLKTLLQLLLLQQSITIHSINRDQAAVQITSSGMMNCQLLNSDYFARFKEICESLKLLNSISPLILRGHVNFVING